MCLPNMAVTLHNVREWSTSLDDLSRIPLRPWQDIFEPSLCPVNSSLSCHDAFPAGPV